MFSAANYKSIVLTFQQAAFPLNLAPTVGTRLPEGEGTNHAGRNVLRQPLRGREDFARRAVALGVPPQGSGNRDWADCGVVLTGEKSVFASATFLLECDVPSREVPLPIFIGMNSVGKSGCSFCGGVCWWGECFFRRGHSPDFHGEEIGFGRVDAWNESGSGLRWKGRAGGRWSQYLTSPCWVDRVSQLLISCEQTVGASPPIIQDHYCTSAGARPVLLMVNTF